MRLDGDDSVLPQGLRQKPAQVRRAKNISPDAVRILSPSDRFPQLLLQTVADARATGILAFELQTQSSTLRPETRENSRTLWVTTVSRRAFAMAAINRSRSPMGWPALSS